MAAASQSEPKIQARSSSERASKTPLADKIKVSLFPGHSQVISVMFTWWVTQTSN
jgi:hypothetical protein